MRAELAGPEKGRGFRIAHAALDSSVQRREVSVYDLAPETVGTFDAIAILPPRWHNYYWERCAWRTRCPLRHGGLRWR